MSNRVGFHARSLEEFERLSALSHVDVLEIKPEKFKEGLYQGNGLEYELNHALLSTLSRTAAENDVAVQFHMPPDHWDSQINYPLRHSSRTDHKSLLARFSAYLDMYEHYGLGTSITMHPPLFQEDDEVFCNVYYGMDKGNKCYKKYAQLLSKRQLDVTVGLENMLPVKENGSQYIGYCSHQFKELLADTPFGIVYDTGHARLAKGFNVSEFTRYGKVHTIHLHTNEGVFLFDSFKDDSHQLATPYNLPSFPSAMEAAQRDNSSVICEVKNLAEYPAEELDHYLWHLKSTLADTR